MATNPNDSAARKLVGKFARTLLATTCLTVATGGSAFAVCQYSEGSGLQTSLPTITSLVATSNPGTTTVCGTNFEDDSFFELTGLGTGNYTVSASTPNVEGQGAFALYISSTAFPSGTLPPASGFVGDFGPGQANPLNLGAAAIPLSGDLFFDVNTIGEDSGAFTVAVTTTSTATPEPGTIPMMGLGLAGALALGRKRRKQ